MITRHKLKNIIKSNIKWFWDNDPAASRIEDPVFMWNAFKSWCVRNCVECFPSVSEADIVKIVDSCYNIWWKAGKLG